MSTTAATEVVRQFAAALAARDEAGAQACASAWRPDRDGPARLYNQLVGQVTLDLLGEATAGANGRAAQGVGIVHEGKVVEKQMLLCEGSPIRIAGVATSASHVGHYLEGTAPAVIAWADLPPDPAARAEADALVAALARAVDGEPLAVTNTDVVVYVAHAVANGARLEILDARGLPELGRGVIEAQLVVAGSEPESVFLYRDAGGWRAWTPRFSATTLVAP